MKAITFILITCLFGLSNAVKAGDDENFLHGQVVKTDGSRLSAWVKLPESATSGKVVFRDNQTGKTKEVNSQDIESITVILEGETVSFLRTRYINDTGNKSDDWIWMRTVSRGEVTVYKAELDQREPVFLLKRDNEKLPKAVTKTRFSHEIIHYISDNEYLMKDVAEGEYEYVELGKLMNEYNAWKSFE
jgi:hypothetical protein